MSRLAALLLVIFAIGTAFIVGLQVGETKTVSQEESVLKDGHYKVAKVIDGDTIELDNGERIRYEGIDAPELNDSYGPEARQKNFELVWTQPIYLELSSEVKDNLGRYLGYIWADENLVNKQLVEEGYAKVYIYKPAQPPKYLEELQTAEKRAKDNRYGMWIEELVN